MSSLKYPPQAEHGKLMLSDNAVVEAIISAIQTRYGERVLRNAYGNDLDEFTVTSDLSSMLIEMQEAVAASTVDYLPLLLAISGDLDEDGNTVITVNFDDDIRIETITVRP